MMWFVSVVSLTVTVGGGVCPLRVVRLIVGLMSLLGVFLFGFLVDVDWRWLFGWAAMPCVVSW